MCDPPSLILFYVYDTVILQLFRFCPPKRTTKVSQGRYEDNPAPYRINIRLDIDLNSISLNPDDYVGSNWISRRDGTYKINVSTEIAPYFEKSYSGFIQYAGFVNCFALKLPSALSVSN